MIDSQYLVFHDESLPERKTKVFIVCSKSSGDLLGAIRWHGAWRQYIFAPGAGCIFNKGCMLDILQVIDMLMAERRTTKEN